MSTESNFDDNYMDSENDHTSVNINIDSLEASLQRELDAVQPSSKEYCIYRVPKRLRQSNGKEYTPQTVSIGPFHHGREELKAMEMLKRRYLKNFLKRTTVTLGDFLQATRVKEARIRNAYAEVIEFDSEEFIKMILIDAVFIMEVFLIYYFFDESNAGDPLYDKPWLITDVKHDIFLLENQLPFFILKDLFEKANLRVFFKENQNQKLSMVKLTQEFCIFYWDFFGVVDENLDEMKYSGALHLVDFLRTFIIPSGLKEETRPLSLTTPSVTKLHKAGVKIKPRVSSKSFFDIKFNKGVLEIPLIKIRPSMEILLKNLLAFEKTHLYGSLISDYVILLSYLIDTAKDVDLLVQEGIIEHRQSNNEAVSALFHNFIQLRLDLNEFYFASLVNNLNNYCKNPFHNWKANLKQDYFRTPWVTASVIAGVILLILTFVQTVCSILQVHNPQGNIR